jgi:hypothetical protein
MKARSSFADRQTGVTTRIAADLPTTCADARVISTDRT